MRDVASQYSALKVTNSGANGVFGKYRGKQAMSTSRARFQIGQLVRHKIFDYRGVVFDVDATFQSTDEWYETVALSRPPKDEPWYHVLVHEAEHTTYVAERNLQCDLTGKPIYHPALAQLFDDLKEGIYRRSRRVN